MATDVMKDRIRELERLARAAGLKPYQTHFFEVPTRIITTVASYGLPTRYSHWSFGRAYEHQCSEAEMGRSKIYELILNNDPAYAFLDKSNTDTANLLVAAHCLAHSDFFANNMLFQQIGETSFVDVGKKHAAIIEQFKKDFGDEVVDDWLDIALSIERHIDIHKGLNRPKYLGHRIVYEEREKKPWEDLYDSELDPVFEKKVAGIYLPPKPERDLLWFLSEYASLEPWQRRILEIVRRESFYFWPQYRTKILNEGWAAYWHAELLRQYSYGDQNEFGVTGIQHPLTSEEHLDFVALHEKVVQPGLKLRLKIEVDDLDHTGRPTGKRKRVYNPILQANPGLMGAAIRLNPYYVGFRILRDIEKRWDEYYKKGFMEDDFGRKVPVTINGRQKLFQIREECDDVSLLRNYLTEELAAELHLFSYGNNDKYKDDYRTQQKIRDRFDDKDDQKFGENKMDPQIIENKTVLVHSKDLKEVVSTFARVSDSYGAPVIVARRVDADGTLRLEHLEHDPVNVDIDHAEHVLKGIYQIWKRPLELIRKDGKKTWVLIYNNDKMEVNWENGDYPETIEKDAPPSAW